MADSLSDLQREFFGALTASPDSLSLSDLEYLYYYQATAGGGAGLPFVPAGGTTGQVLKKNSNTDFDTGWTNAPSPWKGTWSGATTYAAGDLVEGSDASLYASVGNSNLNHNPVGDDGTHWTIPNGEWRGVYSNATTYRAGDLVEGSNANLYASVGNGNINHNPVTDNGVHWTNLTITGTLLAANNLSDLNNTATARTNLGLGSAATSATTDFDAAGAAALRLLKTANLSDLTDAPTARTNLGFGPLGDSSWIAPTLLNSWVNFGVDGEGDWAEVGYRIDGSGFVHIKGRVKSGNSGTVSYAAPNYTVGNQIFTLPAGYRPDKALLVQQWSAKSGSQLSSQIYILPTGDVVLTFPSNTALTWLSLANICFKAA